MTRKASIITMLSAMAISVIIVIVTVSNSIEKQRIKAEQQFSMTTTVTTPLEIGYYLKEYNGTLAIFRGESDTPFKKLDVNINLLSDYDKVLLHDGIFVQTIKELNALIEDYTS